MTNFDPPPEWLGNGKIVYCTYRNLAGGPSPTRNRDVRNEPLLIIDLVKANNIAYELHVMDIDGNVWYDSAVITFLTSNYSPVPKLD